jgi:hypothetical protein
MADNISRETFSASAAVSSGIVSNETPDKHKIAEASRIIAALQHELEELAELGEQVLRNYVAKGKIIYKPARQDEQ